MLGFLMTLAMSFSSHAAVTDGGIHSMTQIQAEFVAQQDWIVESLWTDFGVQAQIKSYSPTSLRQLRSLHDALKNNQPVRIEQFDQIQFACKRGPCQ